MRSIPSAPRRQTLPWDESRSVPPQGGAQPARPAGSKNPEHLPFEQRMKDAETRFFCYDKSKADAYKYSTDPKDREYREQFKAARVEYETLKKAVRLDNPHYPARNPAESRGMPLHRELHSLTDASQAAHDKFRSFDPKSAKDFRTSNDDADQSYRGEYKAAKREYENSLQDIKLFEQKNETGLKEERLHGPRAEISAPILPPLIAGRRGDRDSLGIDLGLYTNP
jgi:hypothetical protein